MMEELRNAARGTLQQPTASLIPESILSNITVPTAVDQLWQELSTHNDSDHAKVQSYVFYLLLFNAYVSVDPRRSSRCPRIFEPQGY